MSDRTLPKQPNRPNPKSFWFGCYEYPEWCLEWVLYVLSRMAIFEILELLGKLGLIVAVILFFQETGEHQKRKQYEAWQIIIAMQNKTGNGGRISALEDLNKDKVALNGIDAQTAYLAQIKLKKANLRRANLSGSTLYRANFERAKLEEAKFGCINQTKCTDLYHANFQTANLKDADLRGADLRDAKFGGADLQRTQLQKANLQGANFTGADLNGTRLECAKGLTIEQVKSANNWKEAVYDEGFSRKLKISKYETVNCSKLTFNPSTQEWKETQ